MWFASVCHATSETHSCVAPALLAAETPGEIVVQGGTVVAEAYVAQEQESETLLLQFTDSSPGSHPLCSLGVAGLCLGSKAGVRLPARVLHKFLCCSLIRGSLETNFSF